MCENIRETDGINSGARCRTHSSDKLQNASLTPPFVGMFYEESKTRNLESSSKLIQVEYLSVLRSPRQHFSEISATFQDILFCKQHALGKKRWAMCLLYVQSGHGWEGRPQPKELAQPWVQEGVLCWAVGWSSLSRSACIQVGSFHSSPAALLCLQHRLGSSAETWREGVTSAFPLLKYYIRFSFTWWSL